MGSLPIRFLESMKELLQDEYEAYIASFQKPRYFGLRVNTSKLSAEEFERIAPFPVRRIPFVTNGFYYDKTSEPAKHPYYYAGLYYLQEPSAMTPADCVTVHANEKVLDLCAAPGGKATELGARLQGTGVIIANDISASRAKALLKNIEMQGITNCYVTAETPEKLAEHFPEYFDVILIDAPCSGEGMFRKEPSLIKSWLERGPKEFHELQQSIVDAAVKMLKPGGRIQYSTCTFSKLEDEDIIAELLERNPSMRISKIPMKEGFRHGLKPFEDCVRLYPHCIEGEGHFLAQLTKEGTLRQTEEARSKPQSIPKEVRKLFEEFTMVFISETYRKEISQGELLYKDQALYLLPEGDGYRTSIRYLRTGLLLGTIEKGNRFEPSQALAMSLEPGQYPYVLNLSSKEQTVIKYLKGETIELPSDWSYQGKTHVLVCTDDYPLGWGRVNGRLLKNKYQAGWRMQS